MTEMRKPFRAFHNDSQAVSIGDLAFINGLDAVVVEGSLDIRADRQGVADAQLLRELFDSVALNLLMEEPRIAGPVAAHAAPFRAFADDSQVVTAGEFSVENGTDRVAVHGFIEIRRDANGLAACQSLRTALNETVVALLMGGAERVEPSAPPAAVPIDVVANPFG